MLNEMPEVTAFVAYADDIAIIADVDSRRGLEQKAERIMKAVSIWCKDNKLEISVEKTQYMIFKNRLIRNPTIKYINQTIKRTKTIKYLGITLDEKLNFA